MIVERTRFFLLDALQLWWPDRAEQVYPQLSAAPVVTVMQCSDAVAEPLAPYAFRAKPFDALLIDLASSETALWRSIHPRTRSYIRIGDGLDCQIFVNEHQEEAFALIDAFIARRRFRPRLTRGEWHDTLTRCDVFLLRWAGRPVVARVVLPDRPVRCRWIFSAIADRNEAKPPNVVGALNKALVWFEIRHYKAQGLRWYDLGGVALSKGSDLHSISQFKQSFGGMAVRENILRLARHPLLRVTCGGALAIRHWVLSTGGPKRMALGA